MVCSDGIRKLIEVSAKPTLTMASNAITISIPSSTIPIVLTDQQVTTLAIGLLQRRISNCEVEMEQKENQNKLGVLKNEMERYEAAKKVFSDILEDINTDSKSSSS